MKQRFSMKHNKYILIVIPAIYLIIGVYFQQMTGIPSLRNTDPEYIYFISGLSVANGELELGHVDNPGTPLQYFMALSFRIIYLFRNQETAFIEDALANSDIYLLTSNLILISLISGFLYYAGTAMTAKTKSLAFGLLLQSAPFYSGIIFGNIGRTSPDNLLPIPVMLLTLELVRINREYNTTNHWRNTLLFIVIMAFGLSIKLTFLPLLIIPLFLLPGWKRKLSYIFGTPVLFFLFALPAALRINTFLNWAKVLVLNSGQYGKGEKTIFDPDTFFPNIIKVWNENQLFFLILFLFIIITAISCLRISSENRAPKLKTLAAIIFASIFQVLIVSKHFQQRYFVAILFLIPLIIILSFVYTEKWHLKIGRIAPALLGSVIFLLAFSTSQVPRVRKISNHLAKEVSKQMPAYHYIRTIDKNAIRIVVPRYYGSPAHEYALLFSYGWAGKQRKMYDPYLEKLYPNSIIAYPWDGTFNYWGKKPELEENKLPIYVYLAHVNHLPFITGKLKEHCSREFRLEQTFFNKISNEAFYLLHFE